MVAKGVDRGHSLGTNWCGRVSICHHGGVDRGMIFRSCHAAVGSNNNEARILSWFLVFLASRHMASERVDRGNPCGTDRCRVRQFLLRGVCLVAGLTVVSARDKNCLGKESTRACGAITRANAGGCICQRRPSSTPPTLRIRGYIESIERVRSESLNRFGCRP